MWSRTNLERVATDSLKYFGFLLCDPSLWASLLWRHRWSPPPPFRYEAPPPIPGPGYIWVDGYWVPEGGRGVWKHGAWVRPPSPEPTGRILTTITIPMAGMCTRATGRTRTAAIITGITTRITEN
jgi:WXXGXW repeat (2 copies)